MYLHSVVFWTTKFRELHTKSIVLKKLTNLIWDPLSCYDLQSKAGPSEKTKNFVACSNTHGLEEMALCSPTLGLQAG